MPRARGPSPSPDMSQNSTSIGIKNKGENVSSLVERFETMAHALQGGQEDSMTFQNSQISASGNDDVSKSASGSDDVSKSVDNSEFHCSNIEKQPSLTDIVSKFPMASMDSQAHEPPRANDGPYLSIRTDDMPCRAANPDSPSYHLAFPPLVPIPSALSKIASTLAQRQPHTPHECSMLQTVALHVLDVELDRVAVAALKVAGLKSQRGAARATITMLKC